MLFRKKDAALSRNYSEQIEKLKQEIKIADAIVIGAGAGLSASAGLVYTGERLEKYFGDFVSRYHFRDMYSGGFYPYTRWKNIGHTGAGIFISTGIWMRRSRFTESFMIW